MIFSKMVLKVSIPHKGFFGKIWKYDGIIFQGISFENWRRSRQPALVLHVLRLVLHVLCLSRFRVPPLPTSYRLPAKREALVVKSEVKWSEWVSEWWKVMQKRSFIFPETYIYDRSCIYL